jgi:hypothetical protein
VETDRQALLEEVGIARSRDLEHAGVSRTQVRRLCQQGRIERVGRGLYRSPGAPLTERRDLAEATRLVPGGIVCLLWALRFHGLTTQHPFEVWLAIDRKAWRPRTEHPPLRRVHLSGTALRERVEAHDVGGVRVRVFSAAKTVADCFKFRNKIGTDVAVGALREYRRAHGKRLDAHGRGGLCDARPTPLPRGHGMSPARRPTDLGALVRARLRELARRRGVEFRVPDEYAGVRVRLRPGSPHAGRTEGCGERNETTTVLDRPGRRRTREMGNRTPTGTGLAGEDRYPNGRHGPHE